MRRPTLQDRVELALIRSLETGVSLLPGRAAARVGESIGELVRFPLGLRRGVVESNLRRAFPEADPQWLARVERETYRHLGREAVEMIRLSHLSREEVVALTEVPAWGEVQDALSEGRGALLVTGHYGNWEVAAAAVAARGVAIDAVVKRQRNRLVDARVEAARRRLGIGTIEMRRAPALLPRVLSRGGVVGIVADQDAGRHGVWVPFFGEPASTFRGPALFAIRLRAPLFAAVARRRPDGRYDVLAERIPVETTGDLEADVLRLTRTLAAHLEREVREEPGQYFWFHKRWKTRPPAEHSPEALGISPGGEGHG